MGHNWCHPKSLIFPFERSGSGSDQGLTGPTVVGELDSVE